MVVAYGFNLHHLFGGTKKDLISTICLKKPLNVTYKIIFFFHFLFIFRLTRSVKLPKGRGEG